MKQGLRKDVGGILEVLCARSMTVVVTALAEKFRRESECEVAITLGTVGALQAKLAAGVTADVVILGSDAIAAMAQAGAILPGSRRDLARTSIGVAVREGRPAPDISTPAAFKQALIDAPRVAFSDPAVGGSAGVHLAALWERMGLSQEIAGKAMPQSNGAEVASRVAEGRADLGLTLIAEIVPVAGVRVIGRIPAPLGKDTTYAAGILSACGNPAAANAFIGLLASPAEAELWSSAGFERVA